MSAEVINEAVACYKKGDYKKALRIFDENVDSLNKYGSDYSLAYAWCLQERLRYSESIKLTEKILKEKPGYSDALLNYTICLGKQNRHKDAVSYYKKILDDNPEYTKQIGYYGYLLERVGQVEKAEEYYKKGLEVEPGNLWYISHYALYLHKIKRLEEAKKWFEKSLNKAPENTWTVKRYAFLLRDLYGEKKINEYYRNLLNNDPANPNHYINYAEIKIFQNEYSEAEDLLNRATKIKNPIVITIIIKVYVTTISILRCAEEKTDMHLDELKDVTSRYQGYIHRDYTELTDYMLRECDKKQIKLFNETILIGSNVRDARSQP